MSAGDRSEGRRLGAGRYQLDGVVGRGGMGTVYAAWDTWDRRRLAIKVLHPELSEDEEVLARAKREADALRGLDHPRVVRITDAGSEPDGRFWIAMELVEGRSLADRLDAGGRKLGRGRALIPLRELLPIAADIADALAAVHAAGLVHRDVKPGNIVIERSGRAKLVDFGVSKPFGPSASHLESITRPGGFVGTEGYAAPEQYDGDAVAASDVFSLALTVLEGLGGGNVPREATGWPGLVEVPWSADVARRLRMILLRALSSDPAKRPPAAELASELRAMMASLPAEAPPAPGAAWDGAEPSEPETRLPRGVRAARSAPAVPRTTVGSWNDLELDAERPSTPRGVRLPNLTAVFGAVAVLAAGLVLWLGSRAPTPGPIAVEPIAALATAQAAAAAASELADGEAERLARARTEVAALEQAFKRDLLARGEDRHAGLRYDCARLRRLAIDLEGTEEPRIASLEARHTKRCKALASGR